MLALSVAAIIGINAIGSKIYDQFTRGTKKIELAGRPDIWARYFKFIESNKYFGNYSQKLEVNLNMNDQKQHSHNSFIQVAANHGLIIASLFLILLFGNITRRNYIYIIALAIYSLAQYGIFWGFSITDIVLFIFFQGTLLSNDKQKLIPDYDY